MKYNLKACLKWFFIASIQLVFLAQGAFSAEEARFPVFEIKLKACQNLIKNFLAMPEIIPVQKAYSAIFKQLLENKVVAALDNRSETCFTSFLNTEDEAESLLFIDGKLVSKTPNFLAIGALFDSLTSTFRNPEKTSEMPDLSWANPSDEIAARISLNNLAKSLQIAFLNECRHSDEKKKTKCEINRKAIKRRLKKTKASFTSLNALPLDTLLKCPFGGNFSINPSASGANSDDKFEVLCNHKTPLEPKLDQMPETTLGGQLFPFLSALKELPDLKIRLNSSEGLFSIELPTESSIETKLEVPEERYQRNPLLKLEWISSKDFSIPISERIPSVVFLGLNPFVLEYYPPEISSLAKMIPPGVIVLSGIGANFGAIFGQHSSSVPVAIGILDKENTVQDFLIHKIFRTETLVKTNEDGGVEFSVIEMPKNPWEEESRKIGILECDKYKYFTLNNDIHKALIRTMNGEERRIDLFKNIDLGEKVKFVMAFRMDTLGELVSLGASSIMFEDEKRKCHQAIYKAMQGKSKQEMEKLIRSGILSQLEEACPRKGMMIKNGQLICAVHEYGWGMETSALCRVNIELPKNRWFVMALVKRQEKAILEARIITATEESK